jgi:hypothetical protein
VSHRLNAVSRRLLAAAAVVSLASGCTLMVSFTAETTVDADGAVRRATRLAASRRGSQDELFERYELPPDGVWGERVVERPGFSPERDRVPVRLREVSFEREFGRGEPIPADYIQHAVAAGRSASNRITVRTRRLWLLDTYVYEERFRDIVTLDGLTSSVRELYGLLVDTMAEQVAAMEVNRVSAAVASARLRAHFDSRVAALLDLIETQCAPGRLSLDACLGPEEDHPAVRDVVTLFEEDDVLVTELVTIFPAPAAIAADDWRDAIETGVLDVTENRLERQAGSERLTRLIENIFGVHGFALFESYPFELSLTLPGAIVSTNADSRDGGMLRWSFEGDDFVLGDRVLYAESRVVHAERVVYTAILAGLIVFVAGFFALRGRVAASWRTPV